MPFLRKGYTQLHSSDGLLVVVLQKLHPRLATFAGVPVIVEAIDDGRFVQPVSKVLGDSSSVQ